MTTHTSIDVGDYLHYIEDKTIGNTKISENKYYLILDISDKTIDIFPFAGTPLCTANIFELSEVQQDFSISIIDNAKFRYIYEMFSSGYCNREFQEHIGTEYSWNAKTVMIPASRLYYAGNGVWREKPALYT